MTSNVSLGRPHIRSSSENAAKKEGGNLGMCLGCSVNSTVVYWPPMEKYREL